MLLQFLIQVEKEAQEKERVQSRLDSKISDLTQVRDSLVVIYEVPKTGLLFGYI